MRFSDQLRDCLPCGGQEHEQELFPFQDDDDDDVGEATLAAVEPIKRYNEQFDTDLLEREKFVFHSVRLHATRENSMNWRRR